jgi:hypothetical protein
LSHGVDTLARVLEHTLTDGAGAPRPPAFAAWLADYLERRISVAAWLLDHWDASPPLPPDTIVGAAQFAAILERWRIILDVVRGDRELRGRLHWDNGVLAAPGKGEVLDARVDWPVTYQFTMPVRGAFGLFVGEVIANAVRHGAPRSTVRARVSCDRVRRELMFEVENDTSADRVPSAHGDAYGGIALLETVARLCGWRALEFTPTPGRFRTSWSIPVSERPAAGAD